ncbi:hypothetical protein [Olivibacter sitiensis]|uniref:hypothetical protein n=1 Tax=Olivibacter sitiensis TaxID=376470 RepID=UPI0003F715A2|nr:hypothetical protein [Olivibacter sitiensis]
MAKHKETDDVNLAHILKYGRHKVSFQDLHPVIYQGVMLLLLGFVNYGVVRDSKHSQAWLAFFIIVFMAVMAKLIYDLHKRLSFFGITTHYAKASNEKIIRDTFSHFRLPTYQSPNQPILYTQYQNNRRWNNPISVYAIPLDGEIIINFRNRNFWQVFNFSTKNEDRIISLMEYLGQGK